jgi:hypothetical protein
MQVWECPYYIQKNHWQTNMKWQDQVKDTYTCLLSMDDNFSQCMNWDNLISKMTGYWRDYQGLISSRDKDFSLHHHNQRDSAPPPPPSYPVDIRDSFLRGKENGIYG